MIVVTGATGNVGRHLVAALLDAGERVTAISRRPWTGGPPEVQGRHADLAVPESLRPVLDGADALFLLVAGGGQGYRPDEIVQVARDCGVKRFVLLSSQATGTRPTAASHAPLRAFEQAVRQSERQWTILRPSGFHSNALAWAEQVRRHRVVVAPFADTPLPTVDPADIAEVAAAVLRDGGHSGRTYVLTGPAPVSPREQAQLIGLALGIQLPFVEQSHADARSQMLQFMPPPVVDGTLDILGRPTAAEVRVSPHVEQVLGRAARPFAEWAVRNAAAFT